MSTPNETILITVDIAANNARLVELTKQLNENRDAQKALTEAGKAGRITADELAAGQVRLKQTAAAIGQETRTLTKANQQQDAANKAATGSIVELRAQLATGTAAYNALSAAERDNTDAGQKLQATNKATSDQLKVLEAAIGDTRRNVGNYAGSIGPLIQELVKLQEQQKTVGEGSAEYKKVAQQIGFVSKAAQEAGAKAGLSYDQTQAKLKEYGDAVRPVIAEVVKLEKEQESLEEGSEAYTRIGFKLAGVEKKLEKIPVETKAFGAALKDAAGQSDVLGGALSKVTGLKEKYAQATSLAKLATGGEVTALGALRLALIATGLGALVVVLGSVVVFLTKTAEGTKLVENVMARVGAVVNVVTDRLGALGKAVMQVLSGDFSGAATTAKAALSGIGDEISREVTLAGDLSKARQQLDRDTASNIDTNKRLLNEVERLKNVRDNEFNTLQVRKKANEDAFAVELQREKTLADLARRRIAILKAEIDQRGGEAKVSLEQLKEYKEAQNELSDIQEDAAGKQNELITNRFQLNKDGLDKEKAAAAALEALRKKLDDAKLKSIEADIAAGKTREEAAAAALAREDAARVGALAKQEKDRTDKLAAAAASHARDLAMLERNLDQRRVLLETDRASGLVTQEQYDARLAVIDEGGFAARLLLARHYNQDANEADKARTRFHNTELEKQTTKERLEQGKRVAIAQAFGTELGALVAQSLTDAGQSLESFAGKFLILILDTLEKQVLAGQVAILVGSLAKEGIAGLIEAAALTATVTAAFEGVKAIISTQTSPGFATGGLITGPGTGTSDSIPARLSNGESVMNANTTAMFAPLLSHLNVLGGGVAFATGGLVPSAGRQGTPRANDGGFVARSLGSGLIDYTALASALERVNLSVGVRVIDQAAKKYNGPRSYGQLGG
jgi:hypothetical protein